MGLDLRQFSPFRPFSMGGGDPLAQNRVFVRDYQSVGLGGSATFSRASSAYMWRDADGRMWSEYASGRTLIECPSGELRFEGARRRQNLIRNSGTAGAVVGVVGAGGAWPTNWVVSLNGATAEILAVADNTLRVKLTGTITQTWAKLHPDGWTASAVPSAFPGQVFTAVAEVRRVSGSLLTAAESGIDEYSTVYLVGGTGSQVTLTDVFARASYIRTFTNAAALKALPVMFIYAPSAGVTLDDVIEIRFPSLENVSGLTDQSLDSYISGTQYYSTLRNGTPIPESEMGAFVEGAAATNAIRNSTMDGAAVGVPGTLPLNWSTYTAQTGLTQEITGISVVGGMKCIGVRISGTPNTSGGYGIYVETATGISAATGQVWTYAVYLAKTAGTLNGVSEILMRINERTAAGSYVTVRIGSDVKSSLGATLAPYTFTATLSGGATVGRAQPHIHIVLSGAPIDITLQIGLPIIVQSERVGTPIPTVDAAATRAADSAISYPLTTPQSQGMAIIECAFPSGSPTTTEKGILSLRSASAQSILYGPAGSAVLRSTDGTNDADTASAFPVTGACTMAIRWNAATAKMQTSILKSGTWTTSGEVTYDGSFTTDNVLRVASAAAYPMIVDKVSVYTKDKGQAWIQEHFR